jgi:hypothetical protein
MAIFAISQDLKFGAMPISLTPKYVTPRMGSIVLTMLKDGTQLLINKQLLLIH